MFRRKPAKRTRAASTPSLRRGLNFEPLETREVLSASPGAVITGIAFNDLLGNQQAVGQPVLANVSVQLFRDGGNGTFDGGVGNGADDTPAGGPELTDAAGRYAFSVGQMGKYFVKQDTSIGFIAPPPQAVDVTLADLEGEEQTTIDGFTTTQSISATPAATSNISSVTAPEAIGGHRDLAVQISSASGEVILSVNPPFDEPGLNLLHFDTLGNAGVGTYTIGWDGDGGGNPPALDFTGLGGVDLTAGGATGLMLTIGADHDNSTATFKIYKDAANWSTVTVAIPGPGQGVSSQTPAKQVFVPFASFSTGGGSGADFSNVGAVQLVVGGEIAGLNGQLSFLGTYAPTVLTQDLANSPQTDLSITKTDGKTSVVPGAVNTYTIVVNNAGPNAVAGAKVVDTFPATFTNVTYTAIATGGASGFAASGSGSINHTVNMPVGSTITYTITGTVSALASGTLVNTATVSTPEGVFDPTPSNNTATDIDLLTPQADLQITKTDGKTSVTPGSSNTYTIVVTNAGESAVTGATIVDNFPANFTGVTYSATATGGATGFAASGSGSINHTVNMPVGSTITYTVSGTVSPSATGTLVNTATVSTPEGVIDPTPSNNTATDTDVLTPQVDLRITKDDGKTSISPGASTTYTVVVTNAGPSAVTGAMIVDTYPDFLTGATFTASATGGATGFTPSGSGNIVDTVNMPVGSTITYLVTGTVSPQATGNLVNTATVVLPTGAVDPTPENNTATDIDTISLVADLQITKTDGKTTVVPGSSNTYTIVVTNVGPSPVTGATVTDLFPGTITDVSYTATATGGASGFNSSGSGNINHTVNMPVGSTITYTVTGKVSAAATGNLVNTATVSTPTGVNDPTPSNNSATDTDVLTPQADLQVTKTDGKTAVTAGNINTYTVVVSNHGPSDVVGATFSDIFDGVLSAVSFTASGLGGASGFAASGSGNINHTVNLPVGSSITYTVTGTVIANDSGEVTNTATVNLPLGLVDLTPGNNTATDIDLLQPKPADPPRLSKALFLGRY